LAIREIGFGEMAFEKLDYGKTGTQENGFREIGNRKNGLSGEKIRKKDIGRLDSEFWAVTNNLCQLTTVTPTYGM